MNKISNEPHATRGKCSERAGYGQTFATQEDDQNVF